MASFDLGRTGEFALASEEGGGADHSGDLDIALPQEIERKFLVRELPPDLEQYSQKEILQGYISVDSDGTEVRLRQKGGRYFQTVKSGTGKTRTELEIEITVGQFEGLWSITKGKRLEKTRFEIPLGQAVIELDIYHGDLAGLLTAEVEFQSEQDSVDFLPPVWFGEEVTENSDYKNQNLAIMGKPGNR